jgi:hypothetical protein
MTEMDILNNLLSDIGNFSLVIFGFTATLFTVIYSFIINKRENLKEISDKIKDGQIDPIMSQRKSNAVRYITSMKTINFQLIISLFSSLTLYIISLLFKYISIDNCIKNYAVVILGILMLLVLIQIIYILITTIKKYINETKI